MRKQDEILADIDYLKSNDMEVCIFGAGKIGTGFGYEILSLFNIKASFYCDNNSKKWTTVIRDGLICISPDDLKTKKNCACIVLVGASYYESVAKQVNSLGIGPVITYPELCTLDQVINYFYSKDFTIQHQFVKSRLDKIKEYDSKPCKQVRNIRNKKIAVYTCITGDYDEILEPEVISNECDYYLISECKPNFLKIFNWVNIFDVVPDYVEDNVRRNRYCKINVSKIFGEYKYSIYIDGNIKILKDINYYINLIGKSGIAIHRHPQHQCLYIEGMRCTVAGIDNENVIREQTKRYMQEGMPREFGQFECRVLVRENNLPCCIKIMKDWWNEVFTYSFRDQISFMYCVWKNGMSADDIGSLGNDSLKNEDFRVVRFHR